MCFDVGETLIDETRVWETWADVLGIPRFTFMAAFGAVLARGGDHRQVFDLVGRPDWRQHEAALNEAFGTFVSTDLYSDAVQALDSLRAARYRIAVFANQPGTRSEELLAIDIRADAMAMSDELGVQKPAPEFFARAVAMMGVHPADVAYVGDRLDNDVRPSAEAGLRPVWLRRGPWAAIANGIPPHGTLVVDSLLELVERIEEAWACA